MLKKSVLNIFTITLIHIQITFQLYIKARDSDPGLSGDDDLDDIFINRALELNSSFTEMEEYTGILNRVTFRAQFRVVCQQDYYGANCSTFCMGQNDNVNGHYTCNSDGSIQCLEGFENPNNNCRDSKLIMNLSYTIGIIQFPHNHELAVINPCDSSACANNGSCTPMGPFNFTCVCVAGYTGPICAYDIDDCLSVTCPNNSMCVDGVDSYECICDPNFKLDGDRCVQIPVTTVETSITRIKNQG